VAACCMSVNVDGDVPWNVTVACRDEDSLGFSGLGHPVGESQRRVARPSSFRPYVDQFDSTLMYRIRCRRRVLLAG
jgi:hypothetical protein